MEQLLQSIEPGEKLVLHSCCGPCSSAVLERITAKFNVTMLYYNSNIWPPEEYNRRLQEQSNLLGQLPTQYPVLFEALPYNHADFLQASQGLEQEPEGGERCAACFALRLARTAEWAAGHGFGWFTTPLTVSPHKNAHVLNKLGEEAARRHGIRFLASDFKKKNGYKRSLELSAEYRLYRQDYCGCEFSQREKAGKTQENK